METTRTIGRSICGVAVALLIALPGCDFVNSEAINALREQVTATDNVADVLATIHDAKSAQESLPAVEQRYTELVDVVKRLPDIQRRYSHAQVSQVTLNQLTDDIRRSSTRWTHELDRLNHTPGLPVAFWKIVRRDSFSITEATIGSGLVNTGGDLAAYLRDAPTLYDQYPYEEIVDVGLNKLYSFRAEVAYDKLLAAAPGAKLYHCEAAMQCQVIIAPVKDFAAFVKKIDLGRITYQDESRRAIEIEVDLRKVPDPQLQRLTRDSEARRKASEVQQAAQTKKWALEAEARERERKGPDRSDPQYFEKLVDRLLSDDHSHSEQAMDALLKADPDEVTSPETKKKIARAFKELAESEHNFERKKAIKGLAKWAGKFSVPIIIKLLGDKYSYDQESVLKTLADLKDARAAPALAAHLADSRYRQIASDGLIAIGSDAEDALIAVAPADDPDVCMTALTLLGEVGSEKCFELMRKAQESRNREVRFVAMAAVQKINKRRLKNRVKAKPKEEEVESDK